MKQGLKKALVMLLTVAMVFTYMAMPVYADDFTVPETDEVIADAAETEAAPEAGEAEEIAEPEAEVQEEVLTEEEEPAPEAIQEEAAEEETVGSETEEVGTNVEETTALEQVLVSIGELSNDPRDFTAEDKERIEAINADYEALSAEDQATVDSTFDHPSGDGQSYGRILEAAVWAVRSYGTDTSTTLSPGTYTTTTEPAVSSESDKGKSDSSRTRNWWVESVVVEDGHATAYIYITGGAATASKLTSYPSVWVGGETIERNSDNNYPIPVDLNGITYFGGISSSMPRPIMYKLTTAIEELAAPQPSEDIELAITNNTGMFKAVTAYLTTEGDQEYLVMALSGTGYAELYKGTYEQAVANGDGTADKGNDTWIHGYTNADGMLEFKIPMNAEETYVPCVAVSNSYYTKYLNGQNSLARAFYPRQFTIDREAKTLVTGDYEFTQELAMTNNVKMFKVNGGKLHTVGGPNSNNYAADLEITMGNDTFGKMYVGRIAEAEAATETIALGEGNVFTVPVKWVETFGVPETMKTLIGEPFIASFHSTSKDQWYEREIVIDEENGTLIFNDVYADYTAVDAALAKVPEDLSIYTEETAKAVTDAVAAVVREKKSYEQEAVDAMAQAIETAVKALKVDKFEYSGTTVQFIKKDGSAFGMWAAMEGSTFTYSDGKIHISIIPSNSKKTYSWIHWGGINEELTKDVTLTEDGKIVLDVDTDLCGWAVPVAPIKTKDDKATTSSQYYLAIPALESFTTAADYTKVDTALAAVPEDLSIYTEETAAAVTAAVNAVDRTKMAVEQAAVDAMAKAIEDAVAALEELPADYSKVDAALENLPFYLGIYTDESAQKLRDIVNNIDRTKKISEQAEVDALAQAIEDAIAGLVEKSEQEMTATVAASKGIVSVGKTTTITVKNAVGEVTYEPLKSGIVTVDNNGKVTAKKVGTVQIKVTAAGDGNFKEATKTVKVYVVPGATTSVTASNLATGMKINWKKVTGATGYKVYRNGSLIATIKSGTTVTYTDKAANTNGTKYTFKIVATASTGTSKLSKSLTTYRVSRPAISSAKNSSAKTMKVTWGKNSKATGYEIMYSTSKSFASGNKTVKIAKASTVSRGIGGLTKGKTYYVKMRTYKTVSGKTYYSAWSVVKTVKITK